MTKNIDHLILYVRNRKVQIEIGRNWKELFPLLNPPNDKKTKEVIEKNIPQS